MVFVKLLDANSQVVGLEDGPNFQIPNTVSRMEIDARPDEDDDEEFADGEVLADGSIYIGYDVIGRMLARRLSMKVPTISIDYHDTTSELYLVLLASAAQSTEELEIRNDEYCTFHESEYGFLILARILLDNLGPKWLSFFTLEFPTAQVENILFACVARSSYLEALDLHFVSFLDDEDATITVVAALMANRSLKRLAFTYVDFTNYQEIFRAAILNTKVRVLQVHNNDSTDSRLEWRVVSQILSSTDCELECLSLKDIYMVSNDSDNSPYEINTSLYDVELSSMRLRDTDLTIICSIFKSAMKLNLDHNQFHNLAPLDSLLIGNNLQLQDLKLVACQIDENSIIDFFRKLPQMTYIRRIDLRANPYWHSHEWRNALFNVVQQNASLESLIFHSDDEDRSAFYSRLDLAFGANRAWRRHMENDSAEHTAKSLPSKLWPLVLERATRISYYDSRNGNMTNVLKADVVFWLVKERMAAELPFTR